MKKRFEGTILLAECGGCCHQPKNAEISRNWKKEEITFSPGDFRGMQLCRHLDFSSVRTILV